MSHLHASLIGALAATTMLAWSGAASAETSAVRPLAALGSGYSADDAPLGAPTELRIDLQGRIAARCELITPPALAARLALGRAGSAQAAFSIDCNAPFRLRVRSRAGGFASVDPTPGIEALAPYEASVSVGTDAGPQELGWCDAAALTDAGAGGCDFSPSSGDHGWSSGEATAINQTGALRLRWTEAAADAPRLGDYRDTIVIELEVRS